MMEVGRVLQVPALLSLFCLPNIKIFYLAGRTNISSKSTVICKSGVIMINNPVRRLIILTYSAASVEATKINIQRIVNIMELILQSRLILPIVTISGRLYL